MSTQEQTARKKTETWLEFLSGNRLAIYTMIGIIVATLIGTLIPQRGPGLSEEQYAQLAQTPGFWTFAARAGFLDVFHSLWFYALILILVTNLSLCTTINFRRVYRTGTSHMELDGKLLALLERRQEFKSRSVDENRIREIMKHNRTSKQEDGTYYFSEKGNLHRYGAIITHIGILTLAAGAVLGAIFGTDGNMMISEGEKSNVVQLRRGGQFELPFSLQCNDFTVEHYPGSRQPKTFRSDITFLAENGNQEKQLIEVNQPGRFGGYRFFQSTYGQIPPQAIVKIIQRSDGSAVLTKQVHMNHSYPIPGGGAFTLVDLDMNETYNTVEAKILETTPGKPRQEVRLFLSDPELDIRLRPDATYTYQLANLQSGGYYTGLSVARNPGVNIVWAGSALGAIGLILAFYIPYRRTLVRLKDGVVTVAYADSRGSEMQDQKLAEIMEKLRGKSDTAKSG
jgi:cytochrome c biogenesis protein